MTVEAPGEAAVTDTSTRIITAIEVTWTRARSLHPDIPDVVTTVGSGTRGKTYGLGGYFAKGRWEGQHGAVPELFIAGEWLDRGARATLGTILHEASHGVAHTREIVDTSRQGRWHNKRFKAIAEELGLDVEMRETGGSSIGWSKTSLREETARLYGPELETLDAALTVRRRPWVKPGSVSNNGVAAQCGCGRRIRASDRSFAAGPILCGVCKEPFAPVV